MRDIRLPLGRHHIHGYLLAPSRHKLDGYWHVILTPCTNVLSSRASTLKLMFWRETRPQ